MMGDGTRGVRGARDEARELPYRFVGDDWFGGWTAAAPGGFAIQAQGTEGDDVFTGTDADDTYHGLGGNDAIDGGGGRDHLFGDEGDDTIDGGDGNDVIQDIGAGFDVIYGGKGNDVISTDPLGEDVLNGGKGNDQLLAAFSLLFGGDGNDLLIGQGSELHGGAGNDRLEIRGPFVKDDNSHEVWGGSGADTFAFVNGTSPLERGREVIHDLLNDDLIDLSGLDANENKVGDQAFHLVPEFDGHAKEMTIRYDAENDLTLIELYTNKDMKPDGTILIPGDHTDFVNFVF